MKEWKVDPLTNTFRSFLNRTSSMVWRVRLLRSNIHDAWMCSLICLINNHVLLLRLPATSCSHWSAASARADSVPERVRVHRDPVLTPELSTRASIVHVCSVRWSYEPLHHQTASMVTATRLVTGALETRSPGPGGLASVRQVLICVHQICSKMIA